MAFLRYRPDIETIGDGEAETFDAIRETFMRMGEKVRESEGRAVRVSHAKSTGLVTGTLTIDANLPPEYAQGLAGVPRSFEAVVRFAQGPGEMLSDRISTHRGMAVKILGVEGERLAQSTEEASQDFVLEAGKPSFINSTASIFLANLKAGVSNAPSMPDAVKAAVSSVSRAINTPLEAAGVGSKTLAFFGHPRLHPLAETYFSQAPLRWGDYVAKLAFFPSKSMLDILATHEVDAGDDENAFQTAMVEQFARNEARFELRVQLATNLDDMPIEDAAKDWPQEKSPYRRVGELVLPPQVAWSRSRSAYIDERMSFKPANGLAAHRPLGQIMRARLLVYERLRAYRQNANGAVLIEPRSLSEIPA
jgi:hypothetical protein